MLRPLPTRAVRALLAALLLATTFAAPAQATAPAGAGTTIEAIDPSAIVPGSVDRSSLALSVTYDVAANLDVDTRALRTTTTLRVTNTSGGGIDRLELNTIAARLGGLRITRATVDGRAVTPTIDDQTVRVPLGGILPAGASATVVVGYRATLRSGLTGSDWLFTRANGIVSLYRWIPWVSRRTAFSRPNHGDPFVTPVSPRVVVRLTTDRPMRFATTGDKVATDGLTQTYRATNVRDFIVTGASDYRVRSRTVGDTIVRVYARPGAPAAAMLDAAATALTRLEARVGPYPYRTLDVAQSSGRFGMEGPGIVWIPTGAPAANLRYLVTHEVAHQWFYGVVGNDQARQPFADEAVADFLARYVLGQRRASRCASAPLDRSIYRYSSRCYYEVVYIQGGNLLDDTRKRMGTTAFFRALRAYVDEHRFGLTGTKTLLQHLDDATPLDLSTRFAPRFPTIY